MTNSTISKSIFLSASREIVWEYLTDKDKLGQWFHGAQDNLIEGQDYALLEKQGDGTTSKVCWGNVLEMNRPDRLVYTFTIKPLGGAMTTVIWTLENVLGGTRLSLSHEGISEAAGEAAMGLLMALDKGWDSHLSNMRSSLA